MILPPWPFGASTSHELPRALPHAIVILQQRLSDGGHVHVERALTWNELQDVSAREYILQIMIDQIREEVRTRCGLR